MGTMIRYLALVVLASCSAMFAALPTAHAAESTAVTSPRATVTLLTETDSIEPGAVFRAALRFRLAPGWHTYWFNPGDAGGPAEAMWTIGGVQTDGRIDWPAPMRIPTDPLMTFGYEGEVILPVTLTAPATLDDAPVLEAQANWLVCADICVPEDGTFRIALQRGPVAHNAQADLFARADAALPRPAPFAARVTRDLRLRIEDPMISPRTVRDAFLFPWESGVLQNAAPQRLEVGEGWMELGLTRGDLDFRDEKLNGSVLTLTDGGGQRSAFTLERVSWAESAAQPPARAEYTFWTIALFAFLGGLLLNLMPCVFPVLAMKAVSLAKLSGAARGTVRWQALSYTAGVVASFLVLGGGLIAARAAGAVAGWGFQFSSPVFIACAAWLMVAVGLSLSGVFHVEGTGAGQALTQRHGHAGSFFTGVLAVVVASPCTAPFMATALGAALVMPPVLALGVFAALGLGLAAPYALLGIVPALARLLPKPGAWMERLKQVLAFPMYGAAVWLVWVLSQVAGPDGVLTAGVGIVLVAFAAWLWGIGGLWPRGLALAALAGMLALLPSLNAAASAAAPAAERREGVEPFSAARLAALRAEGKPVFVDMTAAWCVTCLVNERVAINVDSVRAAFAQQGIVMLRGDWTRQDPAITEFLRAHGRDGVPFYQFYPAGGSTPVELPQVLTPGIVLDAIR